MKKLIFLVLSLIVAASVLVACGSSEEDKAEATETLNALGPSVRTEGPKTEAETPAATKPEAEPVKREDYDYFFDFKAPDGNPRDIVYDYMYAMSQVKWTAAESWTTTWKGEADFGVNLSYEKGKTYYGVPYARTNATLDEFLLFLPENKQFTPTPSPYYEEIVGNHCSSSMVMSFQQIIPLTYSGSLKPVTTRTEYLMFPEPLEVPPSRNPNNPDDWISSTVFSHNGQEAVYEAYTKLEKGDILYKSIDGSGHTRMVSKVEISRSAAGKLMPARSFVYCLEQTNAWADSKKESTWFIDRKYTFSQLYDTFFMPVTLKIYHEENPVIEDAYIAMKGKNTPETLKKMLNGTIESNFPLAYARLTITDKDGKIVGEHLEYYLTKSFKINLRNFTYKLGLDNLEPGEYTFNCRAGIARGGVDIETVKFTID
ncbi:MAG: hypothetical protein E7615_01895 [Ruminococcaceae bacterium]|nr:hypothetical protein [Oscillospiraceae bacterium]